MCRVFRAEAVKLECGGRLGERDPGGSWHLDNYGHRHPKAQAWLGRHPCFVSHYAPTSGSWLNAVEGFLAELRRRRLKRGVFRSLVHLQGTINHFRAEANGNSKPFAWTADPDKIIAAVRRGYQRLESIQQAGKYRRFSQYVGTKIAS